MGLDEHDRELLRLVKGTPQPEPSIAELARLIGEDENRTRERVERLVAGGRMRREGARLIAVDHALDDARPDEQIP
ncbi:hypothetical protein [Conexibacter arvalis]|uniref:DNA-binding Lrp family transcriptional regulator n=1 Tax=Conexibacter arvalis TaxID=912552 RepID=A0A840IJA7_9ACTN|nr:hypothetical protein [Conexibacter arvalis]MBB4665177.1 DNA-binding Lrp family transcriptional regulator [Conexibacter arvalis]